MSRSSNGIARILLNSEKIAARVQMIGAQITEEYQGKSPLLICVLKGAVIFHADLIRNIDLVLSVDFMALSSYGSATESSGEVRLIKDLERSIQGEDIILVEDIVDTGLTLRYLLRHLKNRTPASLRVCTLLSKEESREVEVPLDYCGFEIPDEFVVGYGLDYNERFRNLPHIGVLDQTSIHSS